MIISGHTDLKTINLKTFAYDEKRELIVTKSGSKYEDDIWSFVDDILQKNIKESSAKINWKIKLENNRFLTDPEFIKLLETSKDLILGLRTGQNAKAKINKPTTVIKTFRSLVPLLKWMVDHHITDFTTFDSIVADRYLVFLRQHVSRYGKALSTGELFKRLDVINEIWKSNRNISNPIITNPFPHENTFKLSGITRTKLIANKFNFIPDEIAMELGKEVADYIENRSFKILAAKKAIDEIYSEVLKSKSDSVADKESRQVANKHGYQYVKDVNRDVGYLRTACYIAVAMFTGIRDSEICSLEINSVEVDPIESHLWIHGYIYKTSDSKIEARWMAPPIVGKAIKIVEELTSALRNKLDESIKQLAVDIEQPLTVGRKKEETEAELMRQIKCKKSLWLVESSKLGNSISTNKSIHQQLIEFINNHQIPQHNGKVWGIHPHQFRKTFVVMLNCTQN